VKAGTGEFAAIAGDVCPRTQTVADSVDTD
jgi:hypothetical protein